MAWVKIPIQEQWTNASDVNASGFVVKCYLPGTTTNTPIAIDKNGTTTVSTATLNADGFPEVSGNEVALYIDRDFKIAVYENATDASNDTNAFWGPVDNVKINSLTSDFSDDYWVDNYVTLRAKTSANYTDGDVITITDDGIAGQFVVKTGTVTDNGGTLIVPTDDSNRYVERVHNGAVNVKWFGANGSNDGVNDSPFFQAALDAHDYCYVPGGSYNIDETVNIETNKTLFLSAYADIRRRAANSSATTPLFHLKETRAGLVGASRGDCLILTENASPNGVVKIGHDSISDDGGRNVLRCSAVNLQIFGATDAGSTTGDLDVALKVTSCQVNNLPSYYHQISGCYLSSATYGLWLESTANACTISDMVIIQCGNATRGASMFLQGCQDTVISNVFMQSTADSVDIRMEDVNDGTATRQTIANSLTGCNAETSGASSKYIVANSGFTGSNNFVQGIDNVAGGVDLGSSWRSSNNQLIRRDRVDFKQVNTDQVVFPSTQVASSDNNTLDDYQETGAITFNPTIDSQTAGSGRATTVTDATALKIGRRVFFDIRVTLSTLGSGGSGDITIEGLPYDCVSGNYRGTDVKVGFFDNLAANVVYVSGFIESNSSNPRIRLRGLSAAGTTTASLAFSTYAQANTEFWISGSYYASA